MKSKPRTSELAVFLWFALCTNWVYAASFSDDVAGFDWLSLGVAAGAGLFAGVARTVYTLMSSKYVVLSVWREVLKDLFVAAFAGSVAYILVEGLSSYEFISVPRQMRLLTILAAGWNPAGLFNFAARGATALIDNAVAKARGGAPPDAPSSSAVPLEK